METEEKKDEYTKEDKLNFLAAKYNEAKKDGKEDLEEHYKKLYLLEKKEGKKE